MQKIRGFSFCFSFKKDNILFAKKKSKIEKMSILFIFFKRYFEIPNKNEKNDSIGNKMNVSKKNTVQKKKMKILVNKKKKLNKK